MTEFSPESPAINDPGQDSDISDENRLITVSQIREAREVSLKLRDRAEKAGQMRKVAALTPLVAAVALASTPAYKHESIHQRITNEVWMVGVGLGAIVANETLRIGFLRGRRKNDNKIDALRAQLSSPEDA